MIRVVATASLLALLILVLYLPSAYPPERFMNQLRAEHALNADFWGSEPAMRILERMLDFQTVVNQATPVPTPAMAASSSPIDDAVGKQMWEVNARLFNNSYFRSVETLLALASYRLSALLEPLPFLLIFMAAAVFDGLLLRILKSKEFRRHEPEMFALHVCGAIVTACATVVAFVLPVTLTPPILCLVPVALCAFASRAVANFHRRG
jgi:hypothetical protein